jgi:seryl-tRNA synthetase
MNINELIAQRKEVKEQISQLNEELKDLKAKQDELDFALIQKMDAEGLSRTANDFASVSINEEIVPDVADWDALYEHIITTKDFSLLQRRVSSTAYRELLKIGEAVPGLEQRHIRRINFRSL